jgi:hypothetical protein
MRGGCWSPFECAADQQFNQKKVAQELRRYRQKGPGRTTRLLVDGIVQSAPISGRLARNPFRTFVHPVDLMDDIITGAGLRLSSRRETWMWSADVYVRA